MKQPKCSRILCVMATLGVFVMPAITISQAKGVKPATPPVSGQSKQVSNVFQDTDLKQALSDLGTASGVSIVPDDTVQGNVTASIKNRSIEQALDLLLLPGGYSWTKIGETYLVGKADPTSPNFLKFASSRIYKPNFLVSEKLAAQLPTSMAGYIKAAPGERTMTITAAPAMMERIMRDIKLLDQPATRIVLEALITEANTTTLNQFDLSFVWKHFGLTSAAEAQTLQLQYTQASQADVATLKALVAKGLATIKASPRVMTIEGKEASIEVGQESYFDVVSGPVNFPYTTLQQIKTGISLKMTPYLSDDGQITVQLAPEVSDVTGAGPNGLPINTVRRANTMVRVKEGETIIIGGMTFESKRRFDSKIPILGELPLVGNLFHYYHNETKDQDVIIMITPKVIRDVSADADVAGRQFSNGADRPVNRPTEDKDGKRAVKFSSTAAATLPSVNRATENELASIPEIGPTLAFKLCAYRKWHRPFGTLDDLVHVPGFTPNLVQALTGLVQV